MTIDEYLAGAFVSITDRAPERARVEQEWQEYIFSSEYSDEIETLVEMDCYDIVMEA